MKTAFQDRLDKVLAQEGFGTRSEVRKAVRAGKVLVNGRTEKDPGRKVTRADEILFAGRQILREDHVYYMLNKPAGVITATEDPRQRTVLDLLREPGRFLQEEPAQARQVDPVQAQQDDPAGRAGGTEESNGEESPEPVPVLRRGLFPVGRLDKDTEGLLLITDDGQLAHSLLAPGRHVDKVYYALVDGCVTQEDVLRFAQGVRIDDDFTALPAQLCVLSADGTNARKAVRKAESQQEPVCDLTKLQDLLPDVQDLLPDDRRIPAFSAGNVTEYTHTFVTIQEGKFHQVRRMFAAVGKKVIYLRRLAMGPLRLDPALEPGHFRKLTEKEIEELRSCGGSKAGFAAVR